MPGLNEAVASLTAAWRLFLGRTEAMRQFNTSFAGFWRSFAAIILVLPIYIVYILSERQLTLDASGLDDALVPLEWFFGARALSLLLDWITFPILLALLARPLGITRGYVPYIVAHNWGEILFSVPIAIPTILYAYGLVSDDIAVVLTLVGIGLLLRYFYIAARTALQIPVAMAVALVATDVLVSMVLAEFLGRLFGV